MRIRKSRCIELDRTHCCTKKFNAALSLCKVLEVTLYFSKSFLETVAKAPWSLRVTMVYLLEQESSLWSSVPQQRHTLFLRCFLHLSLVNLPLLASLEKRSTHRELGCFLGVGDRDDFKKEILADKATKNGFILFWEITTGLEVKALPCFQE